MWITPYSVKYPLNKITSTLINVAAYYLTPNSLLCTQGFVGAGLCARPFRKALRGNGP